MAKKKKSAVTTSAGRSRYSQVDNVWTMLQTLSVRDIAKKLSVDRRTVQRWKNQGQQPNKVNAPKLTREASLRRREFSRQSKMESERWNVPVMPVPIPGDRLYVKSRLSGVEEFDRLRERAKTDPRFKHERFVVEKTKKRTVVYTDKAGKKHRRVISARSNYFRFQDGGAVVFNIRKVRDEDIVRLIQASRKFGKNRGIVFVHEITKWSARSPKFGVTDEWVDEHIGEHMASAPESLDSSVFDDPEKILFLIKNLRRKGLLVYARITDPH